MCIRDSFEGVPAPRSIGTRGTSEAEGGSRVLRALIRMYQGPDSEYLNFYGPPRAVRTVPYHEVLAPQVAADPGRLGLRGKAVFVGVSDAGRPEQRDGFHTVFSRGGVDLSGAE